MNRKESIRRRLGFGSALVATACSALLIAPWGNSASGAGSKSSGRSSNAKSSSAMTQFESLLKTAYVNFNTKKFPGPTQPVKPPKHVKLTVIECTAALAGCSLPAQGAIQAAHVLGWNATLVNGQGEVARYNTLMENAVSAGSNAIIAVGLSPVEASAGLKAAHAAHIPVLSLSEESAISPTGYKLDISGGQATLGRYDAAYVAVHSSGKADVLPIADSEFPSTAHFVNGFLSEIHKCKTCKIEPTMNLIAANLTTSFPSQLTGYLQSHPAVTWILSPYDPVATAAVCPVLGRLGLLNKVKVVSVLGVPANVAMIKAGKCEVADGAWPQIWNGWAGIDQLVRILAHKPTISPSNENMPRTLIDINHLPPAAGYGSHINYRAAYERLWGIKKK